MDANGTYMGVIGPLPPNPCNFQPQPMSLILNLNAAGNGTLTITHLISGQVYAFSNALGTSIGTGMIGVTASGPGLGGYFTSVQNQLTFIQMGPGWDVTGQTDFIGPCGTSQVLDDGTRTSTSTG
jgi:hypothetical protein